MGLDNRWIRWIKFNNTIVKYLIFVNRARGGKQFDWIEFAWVKYGLRNHSNIIWANRDLVNMVWEKWF